MARWPQQKQGVPRDGLCRLASELLFLCVLKILRTLFVDACLVDLSELERAEVAVEASSIRPSSDVPPEEVLLRS